MSHTVRLIWHRWPFRLAICNADHIEAYCNYVPEIIDYRSIGERVQELRKEKKLIQKDLEGDLQEK